MCRDDSTSPFKCGKIDHLIRECHKNRWSNGKYGNRAQSSPVAPLERDSRRGVTSSTGEATNHLYAQNNRQEEEDSPDVVSGMIKIFDFTLYALLHPGVSLSIVTPYIAMSFDIILN